MTTEHHRDSVPSIPAIDCDLLQGVAQIAAWRGLTLAQCRQQIEDGMIPTHRKPGKATVYAFKSEIVETARKVLVKSSPPVRQRKVKPGRPVLDQHSTSGSSMA